MNGKNKQKGLFRVSIYVNEQEMTTLAKDAEKLGFRRGGIPVKKQKPHGMAGEWLANTDGLGRLFKHTYAYWKEHEASRIEEAAALAREQEELDKRKKKLGIQS